MAMDAIHLLGVKPREVKQALGGDLIKVVRGSRKAYNAYQAKLRRGEIKESDSEEEATAEPRKMWTCEERACGGSGRPRQHFYRKVKTSENESQTDPIDLTHYFDTQEILQQNNLTILTCVPRDIQEGVMEQVGSNGSNISIIHRGSSTSTASQINMERRAPKRSKFTKFFINVRDFLKSMVAADPLLPAEDWTDDEDHSDEEKEAERDPEWLETPSPEGSRDDMQAGYEREQLENPP
jgi:hypothetical protein